MLFGGGTALALWGLVFSTISLLGLLFGNRMAKEYGGAVVIAGAYADSALVEKGWAADRSIARQVKTLQASTPDGVAVYYRPHHGSASELPCFTAALERLTPPALDREEPAGGWALLVPVARRGIRLTLLLVGLVVWGLAFATGAI